MNKRILGGLLCAAMLCAAPALAMPGMGEGKAPVDKFPMMDANKDGSFSAELPISGLATQNYTLRFDAQYGGYSATYETQILLVQDVTGSGSQDLVLARRRGEGLVLTLFTSRDGELVNTQDLALDPRFYSCEQLLYSASPHGHYIVMDGTDQSGYTISDLVCYDQESGQLRRAVEGESLAARTARLKPGLYSCDINGDGTVEIPVVEQEITTEDSARRLSLITWRDFTRASSTVVQFGVLDMEYGFFLRLPVAWMGDVTVSDGPALDGWQVTSADGSLWYLRVLVCSREGAIPGAAREYSQICLLGQNRLLVQENESYLPEGWTAEGLYIL